MRLEALESRALLAIEGLPTAGTGDTNLFGAPIALWTDGSGPNELSITLQDKVIGGSTVAVATITANTTKGVVTNSYYNFANSISFTGTFDKAGGVDNKVSLTTPFSFDLSNGATAFDWNTSASFAPRGLSNVGLKLTNADSLTLSTPSATLTSTVAGTFTSPTLAPAPGAAITLQSNGPVTVLAAGVATHDFSFIGTKNATSPMLQFQGPVKATNTISITDTSDIVIDQPLTAGGTITITTAGALAPGGSITVNKSLTAGGAITVTAAQALTTNGVITSTASGVSLTADNGNVLTINQDVTATTGALTVTGDGGIVTGIQADLLAVTGTVALNSPNGSVTTAGALTALAGVTATATVDLTLGGATTVTGAGSVVATAFRGDAAILPQAPIAVTNGFVVLTSGAGTLEVEAQVLGDLAITLQAAKGIVLSDAVDTAAEVRSTAAGGTITITSTASQVLIDAPVVAQAANVVVTATNDDILVRDDVSALLGVAIAGNTTVTVDGVGPGTIRLESQTGTIAVTSTTAGVTLGPDLAVVAGPGAAAGVNLTAQTIVDLQVPITAEGNIDITSPDLFVVRRALTSNLGAVTITTGSGPLTAAVAPITASGAIKLTAKDSVSVDTTLTSTLAGIEVSSTAGFVSLGTSSKLVAPSVGTGVLAISAAGALTLASDLSAGDSIGVTTGASFAPTKNFTSAAGSITIAVNTGDLDVTGATITALSPAGNVTLSAAGDVTMNVTKIAVGGATGSLSATAGDALKITPSAPIAVGGSITLSSKDPGTGFAPAAGADLLAKTGSIDLRFGGTVDVSNIQVEAPLGSIALASSTGNVVVGTKAFTVETASTGGITLAATNGSVSLGQALTAGADIAISAFKTFTLGFNLTSNKGDVEIASTGGNVDVSKAVITAPNGAISLTAPSGAVNLGTQAYTAGAGFSAVARDTLAVSAPITTTGGGITLQSTAGNVSLTGTAHLTALPGTIVLFAFGEINNGTINGAVTTWVQANTLLATAQGSNGVGPAPMFAFIDERNNVDQLEVLLETAAGVPIGAGLTYVDADSFTVNKLVSAVGAVSLTSLGGGITVNATIGVPADPATTLTDITIKAVGPAIINGGLAANGAGAVTVTSQTNVVNVTGSITTADGAITLASNGGAGITVGGAISGLGTAGEVVLTSIGPVVVNDAIQSTGKVAIQSAAGTVTITGAVAAGATHDFTIAAAGDVGVTGTIFAGDDVDISTQTDITLGGGSITANNGDVTIASTGGTGDIAVAAATITAGGGIVITTLVPGTGTITFDGGKLVVPRPYTPGGTVGLIRIDGNTVAVPGAPTIEGGRLELRSLGVGPIALTGNNSVDSLGVTTGGSFTFNNFSKLLEITDFFAAIATPGEVSTGGNLTITQSMLNGQGGRFRVLDGLDVGGDMFLSANQSALGVEFVTTSTGDNPGAPPAFAGTLRDMLGYINANKATNGTTNATMSAVFDEPNSPVALVGTISLTAALPAVTKRILFDGSLPAATPAGSIGGDVALNGTAVTVPALANGLTFGARSGGSTIRDLAIHGFKGAGLEVRSGSNTVQGVRSGFDRAGNPAGNGVGMRVTGAGAVRNFIGTTTTGNEIGNNTGAGLVIEGRAAFTSVFSNFIGVRADGSGAANGGDGIQIVGGLGNVIGPQATTQGANVISGNGGRGVSLLNALGTSLAFGTRLFNNSITNNAAAGVSIEGGGFNQVGAFTAGNTIQGNKAGGVSVTAASGGNVVSGNTIALNTGDGVLVNTGWATRIDTNTVAGNSGAGVRLQNAAVTRDRSANLVYQNLIQGNGGTQADGGVVVQASSGQVVGVAPGGQAAGNTVSQNAGSGIVILNGGGTQLPQSNTIAHNAVLQNRFDGIRVDGSLGNVLRANTLTANAGAGIAVVNALAPNSRDPRFSQGNVVTANTSSLNAVGIRVQGSSSNTVVGGTLPSLGNRVFSNVSHGISVESLNSAVPNGTRIQGNQVGVDSANGAAGNGGDGIALSGATNTVVNYANSSRNNTGNGLSIVGGSGNFIGSPVKGRANTFAANAGDGILVDQPAGTALTTQMVISGNVVDGNGGNGIAVSGSRTNFVRIGRAPSIAVPTGDENTISNNAIDGIRVNAASNVTMIGNQFTTNGGLPIRLVGGANGAIVPPTIISATARAGSGRPMWDVTGRVTGTSGQRFYIDIYDANTVFLGRVLATVGRNGTGTFRTFVGGKVSAVGPLRATATLANPGLTGGTSQFTT